MAWIMEFSAFIKSLWEEWKILLTGGTPSAGLVFWGYASGRPLLHIIGWVFLAITFLLSVFFSLRKQWREAEKNFIDLSPSELVKLREGKSSPHAKTLMKPFIGKRIKVSGKFKDIEDLFYGVKLVHLDVADLRISARVWLLAGNKFVPIPPGEMITLIGTINSVESSSIFLTSIELIPNPRTVTDGQFLRGATT
jgi:hypothetical protein